MTVEEALYHERNYISAPSDRRLPDGWMPNVDNVQVAPPLTGKARLDYIRSVWQADADGATEDEWRYVAPFNPSAPYWDAVVASKHADRVHG